MRLSSTCLARLGVRDLGLPTMVLHVLVVHAERQDVR